MTTFRDYELEPDDNQAAPPVGAPEGGFKGSNVNNIMREMMSVIAQLGHGTLQLDGTTKPTAAIDFNEQRIDNIGSANNRTSATRNDQVQDGVMNWGGTTTGTGAAYTVVMTPLFTRSEYRPGQQVRCIIHATNTTTTPTLNAGTPGGKTIVHRNGAALGIGDLRISTRYTFEFDGTNWRALDAGGYMEQALYNDLFPVGCNVFMRGPATAPPVPAGVSATWTLHGFEGYLRHLVAVPGAGGSLTTGAGGSHNHTGTVDQTASTRSDIAAGGVQTLPTSNHQHTFTTSTASAHTHTIEPTYISGQLWERTA
jgi:hypothetical protein